MLLTIPAVVFFLMQGCAVVAMVLTRRDDPVSPLLGFTAFGIAIAAFVFSLPALAAIARSDIHGPPRYLLIAVHTLWFTVGGLILLVGLCMKIVFPLYSRWIAP